MLQEAICFLFRHIGREDGSASVGVLGAAKLTLGKPMGSIYLVSSPWSRRRLDPCRGSDVGCGVI